MFYLLLSFFITFSAHSRGHDHRMDTTLSVKINEVKSKQDKLIDRVNANNRLLNDLWGLVSKNHKTGIAIEAKLESCTGHPSSPVLSANPPRLLEPKANTKKSTGNR